MNYALRVLCPQFKSWAAAVWLPVLPKGEKMDRIKNEKHVVGLKQSKKAVQNGRASLVFIARDADMHVVYPMEKLCAENGVEVVYVNNMKELAKACHVEVPTAIVTIVKNA